MDYKNYTASAPTRPAWIAGIIAAAAVIALTSWMSERDREHRREIARLTLTCPANQSGQELMATIHDDAKPGSLQCIYTARAAYGNKTTRKLVVATE